MSREIYIMVKVVRTEKYCVEAKKILKSEDNTKYDLVEQDLNLVEETFQEY
jgi:hypothetical protein